MQVTHVTVARDGTFTLKMRAKRKGLEVHGARLVLRDKANPDAVSFPIGISQRNKGVWTIVTARFHPCDNPLTPTYWDIYVDATKNGIETRMSCKCASKLKRRLAIAVVQSVTDDGMIMFPHIARASALAFIYREYDRADAPVTRVRELAAYVLARTFGRHWRRKDIWLVFEKFCSRAQDNGYYFFKYCMEQLPERERKHIFYVIDKTAPDYAAIRQWDANVIDFMSFKHILYALTAQMYVGSDSSVHLYAYRSKPSRVKKLVNRHPIFFLQHGVMGLKRTDDLFGINGLHPMTYFLTSATREQRIIVENFAYAPENVPIVGLARWDALEERKSDEAPSILVMPTWRSWLEDMNGEQFAESDYCAAYSSLTRNPRLLDLLEQHNATLRFYIHPKFSEYISQFKSASERVEFIGEAQRPLNELIMECSMLVTDYSSVCWDVLYMGKPVCFYQFDQSRFLELTGSYIDLDTLLPGPVCADEDSLVQAVTACAEGNFTLSAEDERTLDDWGLLRDKENCKRTYEFLVQQRERPAEPKKKRGLDDRLAKRLPTKLANRLMPWRGARVNYVYALQNDPLDEHAILLESRHGDAFEGNMYYIARELLSNPEYADFTVFVPAASGRTSLVKSQVASLPAGQKVQIVRYQSKAYLHALATCKYVMNDTSYLHAFYNRPGQVYLNTWHGTPLKYLGRNVRDEAVRMGNVHRNLLTADYLMFPNAHTADAMFESYMLDEQFEGTAFFCGYPRNAALFDEERRVRTRKRFGLWNKRVYAFMPTYRGLNKHLDHDHIELMRSHLESLDAALEDDELVFLNLHPFMAGKVKCTGLKHVRMFPDNVPSYDFLAAVDGLITDYSSVMFDFAATGRPIVLFTYDFDDYSTGRGMYFDVEKTSFAHVRSVEEILPALRSFEPGSYADMQERFCPHDSADATKRLLDYVIKGEGQMELYEPDRSDTRPKVLVNVDGIRRSGVRAALERYFDDPGLRKRHYYVTFSRECDDGIDVLDSIGKDVDYYAIASTPPLSLEERKVLERFRKGKASIGQLEEGFGFALKREWQRRFGSSEFDELVYLGLFNWRTTALFASRAKEAKVTFVFSSTYCKGVPAHAPSQHDLDLYAAWGVKVEEAPEWLSDELLPRRADHAVRCMQTHPSFSSGAGTVGASSIVRVKAEMPQLLDDARIRVGDIEVVPSLKRLRPGRGPETGTHWYRLSFDLPLEKLAQVEVDENGTAPVMLSFVHDGATSACAPIYYDMVRKGFRGTCSKMLGKLEDGRKVRFCQNLESNLAVRIA